MPYGTNIGSVKVLLPVWPDIATLTDVDILKIEIIINTK